MALETIGKSSSVTEWQQLAATLKAHRYTGKTETQEDNVWCDEQCMSLRDGGEE